MSNTEGFFCGTGIWGRGAMPGDPNNDVLLTANPVFGGVDVRWTYPTINPFAVAHVLLYRSTAPVFETAAQIAVVAGNGYYDKLDSEETFYYWIKVISVNGTEGQLVGPASSTTRHVSSYLTENLIDKIDVTHLLPGLKTEIGKIALLGQAYTEEVTTRQEGDAAITTAMTQLEAGVDDAYALIQEEATVRSSATSQLAQQITTVQAALNDDIASVQTQAQATASAVDGLRAQYTIKVSAGNKVAGIGLAVDDPVAGPATSSLIVLADTFGVATDNGDVMPFGVDSQGAYINGQLRVHTGGQTLLDVAKNSGLKIVGTSNQFRVDANGSPWNPSITLTATLATGLSGTVTWSKDGSGTTPPAAGTTNTWTIFAADQAQDVTHYMASLVIGGITYTDTFTVSRVRDGAVGVPGTLTGYSSMYGISVPGAWDSGIANRIIRNMLTGEVLTTSLGTVDHLMLGDTVTLSDGTTYAETRYWDGNNAWLPVGVVIDGNLLVNGTASVSVLKAGVMQTGQNANAQISMGNTQFIGGISTPFHVSKSLAHANQVLISALNDKDESVAIWGASVTQIGNGVAGTWHSSTTDADNTRWQLLGALGSKLFGAAVIGNAYGTDQGAAFRYFSEASNQAQPNMNSYLTAVGLATPTHAISAVGMVEIIGNYPIKVNGSVGTAGDVLHSGGPGAPSYWAAPASTSVTYANVQTAVAAATSAMAVGSTMQVTGMNAPASGVGVELAYGNPGSGAAGFVLCYDRTNLAYKPLKLWASSFEFDQGAANFVQSPTVPTVTASDNSTKAASTAFVKAQGYITASGSISGNAATATNATNATNAINASNVGGYKCFGGSGTTDSSGNITINFPSSFSSSSSFGISALSVSGIYVVVTAASASSVTLQTQSRSTGAAAGTQAVRWTTVGN